MNMNHNDLKRFCTEVFTSNGIDASDAAVSADVLVRADMRGIPSHGVARLGRYINGIREGLMKKEYAAEIVRETPVSLLVDAHGGLGAPVSKRTMTRVIEKAESSGMAMATVRNSNHFGIAGYYAMMALEQDMIGFTMTNTAALGVPTFGRKVMFGTNPIAFAAPALEEKAFVLDMSTTAVTRGKVEVYDRENKPLPPGWAVDAEGNPAEDAESLLVDMFHRRGGGLVPLGGDSEKHGGHKGYGLAVMVDIMTGILAASEWGSHIYDTGSSSALVSHCFGAIKIDLFYEAVEFRKNMDCMLRELKGMESTVGAAGVYYAGQKEQKAYEKALVEGIELPDSVFSSLEDLGKKHGISLRHS